MTKIFERGARIWIQIDKAWLLLEVKTLSLSGEGVGQKASGAGMFTIYMYENKSFIQSSFLYGILLLNDVWSEVIWWERNWEERGVDEEIVALKSEELALVSSPWVLTWDHKLIKVKLVWIVEFFIPTVLSYLGARGENTWLLDPPMSGLCKVRTMARREQVRELRIPLAKKKL